MSNPKTGYTCKNKDGNYQDLSGIFMPLSLGSQISYDTGFKTLINGTPTDFRNIFASISSGSPISFNTGFTLSGTSDLNTIFAAYPSIIVNTTVTPNPVTSYIYNNTKYNILILTDNNTANFYQTTPTNVQINYILVGGGAGGGGAYYIRPGYNGVGGGGGGGGAGGYIKGYFSTSSNIVYNVVGGGGGSGGEGNNNNNNDTNGSPGAASSISMGTNSIYAYGGSNKNDTVYNGGLYGGVQINNNNGLQNLGTSGSYSQNLGTITNAGQGGNGGCGCDVLGRTKNNEYPYGKSPTSSVGSLETGYTLSYLDKIIYVGGGGGGSSNQMTYTTDTADGVPIFNSAATGGSPNGGYGGGPVSLNLPIIFEGMDAFAGDIHKGVVLAACYGGGGGGGYYEYSGQTYNPKGGNGGTGCAILWWIN